MDALVTVFNKVLIQDLADFSPLQINLQELMITF